MEQCTNMYPYIHLYFYMDTYRNMCYNLGTVEKVSLYTGHRHTIVQRRSEKMSDSEKKVSAAQRRATDKYLEKFDEMRVRVPVGQKSLYKAHAEAQGESLNGFINRAIAETMERDNAATKAL